MNNPFLNTGLAPGAGQAVNTLLQPAASLANGLGNQADLTDVKTVWVQGQQTLMPKADGGLGGLGGVPRVPSLNGNGLGGGLAATAGGLQGLANGGNQFMNGASLGARMNDGGMNNAGLLQGIPGLNSELQQQQQQQFQLQQQQRHQLQQQQLQQHQLQQQQLQQQQLQQQRLQQLQQQQLQQQRLQQLQQQQLAQLQQQQEQQRQQPLLQQLQQAQRQQQLQQQQLAALQNNANLMSSNNAAAQMYALNNAAGRLGANGGGLLSQGGGHMPHGQLLQNNIAAAAAANSALATAQLANANRNAELLAANGLLGGQGGLQGGGHQLLPNQQQQQLLQQQLLKGGNASISTSQAIHNAGLGLNQIRTGGQQAMANQLAMQQAAQQQAVLQARQRQLAAQQAAAVAAQASQAYALSAAAKQAGLMNLPAAEQLRLLGRQPNAQPQQQQLSAAMLQVLRNNAAAAGGQQGAGLGQGLERDVYLSKLLNSVAMRPGDQPTMQPTQMPTASSTAALAGKQFAAGLGNPNALGLAGGMGANLLDRGLLNRGAFEPPNPARVGVIGGERGKRSSSEVGSTLSGGSLSGLPGLGLPTAARSPSTGLGGSIGLAGEGSLASPESVEMFLKAVGARLADLNITVEQALNAGILGGLSAAQVKILSDAHRAGGQGRMASAGLAVGPAVGQMMPTSAGLSAFEDANQFALSAPIDGSAALAFSAALPASGSEALPPVSEGSVEPQSQEVTAVTGGTADGEAATKVVFDSILEPEQQQQQPAGEHVSAADSAATPTLDMNTAGQLWNDPLLALAAQQLNFNAFTYDFFGGEGAELLGELEPEGGDTVNTEGDVAAVQGDEDDIGGLGGLEDEIGDLSALEDFEAIEQSPKGTGVSLSTWGSMEGASQPLESPGVAAVMSSSPGASAAAATSSLETVAEGDAAAPASTAAPDEAVAFQLQDLQLGAGFS
eukprot:jgi/Chrzof1/12077/Cz06g20160.t1